MQVYLRVLNRAVAPDANFLAGTEFQGEVLIRFARGQYIWRLEWRNHEPGVVQYRWTRSQQRFESEAAAYEAGQWVVLTDQEMRQYGGWVGQAVDELVERRERLATLSGAVGVVIDVVGTAATVFFSQATLGRMGSGPGTQQPPNTPAPARVPAAASMPLPRP